MIEITTCRHGIDLRLTPRCYVCRPVEDALSDDERFVRLATAVMQIRDFLALHRKATGRSDVNIRKVLALLDDSLRDSGMVLGCDEPTCSMQYAPRPHPHERPAVATPALSTEETL